jgi:drug/metabolite transporter (DMT)-like permease
MKTKKWWIVNIVIMVGLIILFNAIMDSLGRSRDDAASLILIGALAGACSWFITNQIIKD